MIKARVLQQFQREGVRKQKKHGWFGILVCSHWYWDALSPRGELIKGAVQRHGPSGSLGVRFGFALSLLSPHVLDGFLIRVPESKRLACGSTVLCLGGLAWHMWHVGLPSESCLS